MQKHKPLRQVPQYPIESVNNALTLLEMVRDFGQIRISVAAELLDVSVSTVHRLMAMLVYRGYVEQDASKRYVPGPAMGLTPVGLSWTAELRHRARPHLEALTERTGHTSNLVILAGTQTRFLVSAESAEIPPTFMTADARPAQLAGAVGSRQGVALPADKTAGGKALLSEVPKARIEAIFRRDARRRDMPFRQAHMDSLLNELAVVRARGFATNFEATESGISAVAVPVLDGAQEAVAGLSIALDTSRFRAAMESGIVEALQEERIRLEADLVDFIAKS